LNQKGDWKDIVIAWLWQNEIAQQSNEHERPSFVDARQKKLKESGALENQIEEKVQVGRNLGLGLGLGLDVGRRGDVKLQS